jgi:AcrR family transcriptional regulator
MPAVSPTLPRARQKRSRDTLRRILDAFEAALGEHLFDEITVGDLCTRAGCSVGSFYGRVESKDALLEQLRLRIFADAQSALARLCAPEFAASRSLSTLVTAQVQALVGFHLEHRGAIRALVVQARRAQPFSERAQAFNAVVLRRVADSWLLHRDAIRHPEPELAVEQAALMAAGYLRESILFRELWPTTVALDATAWSEQLHRFVLSFLLMETPPS